MARATPGSVLVVGGMPRVDLLPPAELERRYRRGLLRRWGIGLLAAALVTVLVIAGAMALRIVAEARLASERARTDASIAEIAALSEVGDTVRTLDDLEAFRAEAMLPDFEWAQLIDAVEQTLPANVRIVGFDVTTGAGPDADADAADAASAPGATVLLTLSSPVPFDILPAVRGIRTLPMVLTADGGELRAEESGGEFRYELTVVTTQDAYSGRFAPEPATEEDEG